MQHVEKRVAKHTRSEQRWPTLGETSETIKQPYKRIRGDSEGYGFLVTDWWLTFLFVF